MTRSHARSHDRSLVESSVSCNCHTIATQLPLTATANFGKTPPKVTPNCSRTLNLTNHPITQTTPQALFYPIPSSHNHPQQPTTNPRPCLSLPTHWPHALHLSSSQFSVLSSWTLNDHVHATAIIQPHLPREQPTFLGDDPSPILLGYFIVYHPTPPPLNR